MEALAQWLYSVGLHEVAIIGIIILPLVIAAFLRRGADLQDANYSGGKYDKSYAADIARRRRWSIKVPRGLRRFK